MVAVVSGNDLGLFNTSLARLGSSTGGNPAVGQGGVSDYVNLATGNLILREQEDLLVGQGLPLPFVQTYNSLGQMGSAGGWLSNFNSTVNLVSGTVNTAGSTVSRTDGDGASTLYQYNASQNAYVSFDGSGAEDTLSFNSGTGQWAWTEGSSRSQMVYDSSGRLIQVDDAKSGASFTLSYDSSSGNLIQIASADGDALVLSYNAQGQLSSLGTRSGGVTTSQVTYGYDAHNRLSTVSTYLNPGVDQSVYTTTYTYDDSQGTSLRVATVSQSDGSQLSIAYDSTGRVQSVTQGSSSDGSAQTTTFTYNAGETDITDPLGRVTSYLYDASGNLTQVQGPAVNGLRPTTIYAYDSVTGKVSSITDGFNKTVTYGYDANGNLIYQQDPTGATVTRTYNADDQLLTETVYTQSGPNADGSGSVAGAETTRYVYDGNDRLRFIISANGEVTENQYGTTGNGTGLLALTRTFLGGSYDTSALANDQAPSESDLMTWVNGNGGTLPPQDLTQTTLTTYSYDFRGQLQAKNVYDSVDASGNGITDAATQLTQYTYSAQGLLLQTVTQRAAAETASYVYDGLGRLLSSTNALLAATTRVYDDAHNSLIVTAANGLTTTEVRNAAGELISVVQSGGDVPSHSTRYYYDAAGELVATQDPSGALSYRFYDADARLSATVDATGAITAYAYDADGRQIGSTAYANLVNTAGWLVNGQVTGTPAPTASADDRTTHVYYDASGRVAGTLDANGYLSVNQYDEAGQLVSTTAYANAPTGDASSLASLTLSPDVQNDRITRYYYDRDGRKVGTLDAAGYLTTTQYDRAGRVIQSLAYAKAPTGDASSLSGLTIGTDPGDQLTRYFYDRAGNETGILDADGYLTTYGYNTAQHSKTTTYYTQALSGLTGTESLATLVAQEPANSTQNSVCVYDALGRQSVETDRYGTVTRYVYDALGNLTATYAGDNTTEVRDDFKRYDLYGNLIGAMSGEGAAQALTSLGRGTEADLSGLTDTQLNGLYAQYGTTYVYNNRNQLAQKTDQGGNSTWYFYDADGRQTHTVNALGQVQEIQYDAFGDVTSAIQYAGSISTDSATLNNLQAAIGAILNAVQDRTTGYLYDHRGQVTQKTDARGYLTNYSKYDAFGDLKIIMTPTVGSAQTETDYSYDTRGLKTGSISDVGTGHLNVSTSTTYDAFGRVTSTTDGNNNVTHISYNDPLGRIITTSLTVGGTNRSVQASYDAFGRVLTQTDAFGNQTSYVYDDVNHTLTVTTPEHLQTVTSYDEFGATVSVQDAAGGVTQYAYTRDGQLKTTTDADGNVTTDNYNNLKQLTSTMDADGNTVVYSYDAVGRVLTRTVDPNGLALRTTYGYNAESQTVSVTDGNGVVTQTSYDQDGNKVMVAVDPNGLNLRTAYSCDAQGHELTVTEGYGTSAAETTQYVYDNLGRLTQKIVDPGTGVNPLSGVNYLNYTTAYAYDADNNLISSTDAGNNVTYYTYNEANQLVYTLNPLGAVTRSSYDGDGRITATIRYASFLALNGGSGTLSTATLRNLAGEAASSYVDGFVNGTNGIADSSKDEGQYTVYDKDGRAVYNVDGLGNVTERDYDGAGRVTQEISYNSTLNSQAVQQLRTGSMDLATLATDLNNNDIPANDRRTSTVYDAVGRARFVIDATGAVTEKRYDAVGNVLSILTYSDMVTQGGFNGYSDAVSWAATPGLDARKTDYQYNAAGQLTTVTDGKGYFETYAYDGAGNKISYTDKNGNIWTYTYDAAGNQIQETSPAVAVASYGTGDSLVISTRSLNTYTSYDALGNVKSRTDALGNVTKYSYDAAGNQIGITYPKVSVVTCNATTHIVTTSSNVAASVQVNYDALGRAYANQDVNGNWSYKVYDQAGHVLYDVDATNGVTGYQYDALGNQTVVTRYAKTLNTGKITGWSAGQELTVAQLQQGLTPDQNNDRTLTTTYDAAGRKIDVQQAQVSDNYLLKTGYTNNDPSTGSSNTQIYSGSPETKYQYDAHGQLVKESVLISSASGPDQWAYTYHYYDLDGRKTMDVDPLGYVTTWTYNAQGDVLSTTEYAQAVDTTHLTTGTPPALPPEADDASGLDRTVDYQYDATGRKIAEVRLVQYQDSNGAVYLKDLVTSYGYDKDGNVTSTTVNGITTHQSFDALGRLINQTGAAHNVLVSDLADASSLSRADAAVLAKGFTSSDFVSVSAYTDYALDANGNVLRTVRYASGIVSGGTAPTTPTAGVDEISYAHYDAMGRLTQSQDAAGTVVNRSYDAAGKLTLVSYNERLNGYVGTTSAIQTQNVYDQVGRQISSTLLTNGVRETQVRTQYNTFGEVKAQGLMDQGSDPTVDIPTTFTYDQAGRLLSTNQGDGLLKTYWYDLAGHQLMEQKGPAPMVTYSYTDALGHVTAQVAPSFTQGNTTFIPVSSRSYDRWGNVTQAVDAMGNTTNYYYNQANQVLREVQPMTKAVDDTGTAGFERPELDYYYDIYGRKIASVDANGNKTTYSYDNAGELTRQMDGARHTTSYAYDTLGRQVYTEASVGENSQFGFDASNGQLVQQTAIGDITSQSFDLDDRVTDTGDIRQIEVTKSDGTETAVWSYVGQSHYALNGDGDRISSTDALSHITQYIYDARGNVLESMAPGANGVTMTYGYDNWGNRISYADGLGTQTWTYNSFKQLVGHTDLDGHSHYYTYDPNTNQLATDAVSWRIGSLNDIEDMTIVGDTRTNTYYENGLLKQTSDSYGDLYTYKYDADSRCVYEESKAYDGNGGLVHTGTTIEYDSHNRVVQVAVQDLQTSGHPYTLLLAYEYDEQGNRRHVRIQSSYGTDTSPIVVPANGAPVLMGNVNPIAVRSGDKATFTIQATDIFQDLEGDALAYNAYLQASDGSRTTIPAGSNWITYSYDKAAHQFKFSMDSTAVSAPGNGTYTVVLTADDPVNAPTESSFSVSIGSGKAPTAVQAIPTPVATVGVPFDFNLSTSDYFQAPYLDDTLTLSASPSDPLPSWLTVESTGGGLHFYGIPPSDGSGSLNFTISAKDEGGKSVSQGFSIQVDGLNRTMEAYTVADQDFITGHPQSFSVAKSAVFANIDPGTAVYTATLANGDPLPDWLQFNYDASGTPPGFSFDGVPPVDEAGNAYTIKLTATDIFGSVSTKFALSIDSEQAPAAQMSVGNQNVKVHVAYSQSWPIANLFTDGEGDPMKFSLVPPSGSPLDWSWLTLTNDGTNLTLAGTPPSNAFQGTYTVSLMANDGILSTAIPVTFVINGDHPPTVTGTAIMPPNAVDGMPFSYTIPANTIVDPDGDPLTYQLFSINPDGSSAPLSSSAANWLSFDSSALKLTGTTPAVVNDVYPIYNLRLVASDGRYTLSYDFALGTAAASDAPPVVNGGALSSDNVVVNQSYTRSLPSGLFTDVQGQKLVYSAQVLALGSSTWESLSDIGLNINPLTGYISGSATGTAAGYLVQVIASDPEGTDASAVFTLNINHPPVSPATMSEQVYFGQQFSLSLAGANGFYDPDGSSVNFNLTDWGNLPHSVSLSNNGTLSGQVNQPGSYSFTVKGTSGGFSTTSVVTLNAVNLPPSYVGGLNNITVPGGTQLNFNPAGNIPGANQDGFSDPNNNEGLRITAQQIVNGVATSLPPGFTFDGSWFNGTIAQGSYLIQLTATDNEGASASAQFTLTAVNESPAYNGGISNQTLLPKQSWSYSIPNSAFADPFGGTQFSSPMNYSVSGMPSWMSFSGSTFTGTPSTAGSWTITISASTRYTAAPTTETFTVTVPNLAPVYVGSMSVPMPVVGTAFSYTVPSTAFTDPNGDTLTYSAAGMPPWMTFDSATRTFSGMPGIAGYSTISVTATDSSGLSATGNLAVNVTNVAPVYNTGKLVDKTPVAGQLFTYQIPVNTFTDANGDALIYTVSGMPSWMTFDPTSLTFSGTPGAVHTSTITVVASDRIGASASASFTVTVGNVAPVYTSSIMTDQTPAPGQAFSYQIPTGAFTDPNQQTLTYTTGTLPSWLTFNASTKTFSGTPTTAGSWTVTVTATDPSALAVSGSFTITVPNLPPAYNGGLGTWTVQPGQYSAFNIPAGTFTDANGSGTISYSLIGAPSWINGSNGSYWANNVTTPGTCVVTVVATDDAGQSASGTLTVTVPNVAPVYHNVLLNQTAQAGLAFTYIVKDATGNNVAFTDPNGDVLTYSAGGLPSWLSFNAATLTFTGTPPTGTSGTTTVTLTATDTSGLSTSATFTVTVPASGSVVYQQSVLPTWALQPGQSASYNVPNNTFKATNNATLTYTYNGLPIFLRTNASGLTTNFNQLTAPAGSWTVQVTASDGQGHSTSANLLVTVANAAPVYNSGGLSNQTANVGQQFSYSIQSGKNAPFTDANSDPLTYTVSGMPSWLTFDAGSQTFSGMPPHAAGSWTITVTATDSGGLSASGSFTVTVPNVAPQYNSGLSTWTVQPGQVSSFTIPSGSFTDGNDDTLTYSTSSLPSWLTFNASTQTFTATNPTTSGNTNVTVTVKDPSNSSASQSFTVAVASVGTVYNGTLTSQTGTVGQSFSYVVPTTAFTDANGDSITYSASGLPSWLTFTASTRTFSGTPPTGTAGSWTITVTGNSNGGPAVRGTFGLSVANTAPVFNGPLTNQSPIPGSNFSYQFSTSAFTDPKGDTLTYSATGMPAWLAFNAGTRTFSGVPTSVGNWTVVVTARDPGGLSASSSFTVTVNDTAPVYANGSLVNQTPTPGTGFSYTFPTTAFTEANGETLTYSASGLPAWLTFNPSTRTFSGTPGSAGSWTVTVTATTATGLATSNSFTVTVANVAPVYSSGTLVNQTATSEQAFSYAVPAGAFTDPNGDALTLSASGLPSWLSFNAATGTFSGTPGAPGSWTIGVNATDPSGLNATGSFTVTVPNIAPVYNSGLSTIQSAVAGQLYTYTIPAGMFTDGNGDALTYTATGMPSWLSLDPVTGTFSGIAGAGGRSTVTVTATDPSGASVSGSFKLSVNYASPVYNGSLTDQAANPGQNFNYTMPSGAFTDPNGDPLTYKVTGMPSWMAFNAATLSFVGIAPWTSGSWTVSVCAHDSGDLISSTGSFTVSVNNTAPVYNTGSLVDQVAPENQPFSYTIPAGAFTDPSNDPLTYNVSGLPAWLSFNAATLTFSGTAPWGTGSSTVAVTATDPGGLSTSATFNVIVPDIAPTYNGGLGTWTAQPVGSSSFTLPSGTFSDLNGDNLVYSLSGNPAWLTINSIYGTLTASSPRTPGTTTVTVIATDPSGMTATGTLTIVVPSVAPTYDGSIQWSNGGFLRPAPGALINYQIPTGAFADPNGGGLSFSVNGLPSWLSFNANTRTFSGTAPNTTTTIWAVTVTATKSDGQAVSTTFGIAPGAVAPTYTAGGLTNQALAVGQTLSYAVPAGAFTDSYGNEQFTYTVSSNNSNKYFSPDVSFDPVTQTITGTATSTGTCTITVTATSLDGLQTQASFNITVYSDAPTYNGLPTLSLVPNQQFSYVIPSNAFTDPLGEALTYSIATNQKNGSDLSWLTLDPSTNTLSGVAPNSGQFTVPLKATDTSGLKTIGNFLVQVANEPPIYNGLLGTWAAQPGRTTWFTMPSNTFMSPNGSALTYTVTGMPSWLTFSNATHTFTATNPTQTGIFPVTVTATDQNGLSTFATLIVTISDVAPVYYGTLANQTVPFGTALSYQIPASTFTDMNGNGLVVSVDPSTLPPGVSFDPSTQTFSGTLTGTGSWTVAVTAADPVTMEAINESFRINSVEDAPVFNGPFTYPLQTAVIGQPFTWTMGATRFTDANNEALTYTCTQADGSALPSGLVWNSGTLTLSGVPAAGTYGSYIFLVTATDPEGESASANFTMVIDQPPEVGNQIADQSLHVSQAWSYTIPANSLMDPNGHDLTYSAQLANGTTLPPWLKFDATTGTFSGKPAGAGIYNVMVTATDPEGASASETFTITVLSNANAGLVSSATITASTVPTGASPYGDIIKLVGNKSDPGDIEISPNVKDYWFAYDGDNRATVVDGYLLNGQIQVNGGDTTSFAQKYDALGDIVSRTYYADNTKTTEQTVYVKTDGGHEEITYYQRLDSDGNKVMKERRTFDMNGNLIEVDSYYPANTTRNVTVTSYGGVLTDIGDEINDSSAAYAARLSGARPDTTTYTVDITGWLKHKTTYSYDVDGRLTQQSESGRTLGWNPRVGGGVKTWSTDGFIDVDGENHNDSTLLSTTAYSSYDAAGNLKTYSYTEYAHEEGTQAPPSGDGFKQTFNVTYQGLDSWLETTASGTSKMLDGSADNYQPAQTDSVYDAMGRRMVVREHTQDGGADQMRFFAYDAEGEVMRREEGTMTGIAGGTIVREDNADHTSSGGVVPYIYSGNGMAIYSGSNIGPFMLNTGPNGVTDPAAIVHSYSAAGMSFGMIDEAGNIKNSNLASNMTNYSTGTGGYTVQAGDTLQIIAQRVYGNSELWYIIADANGIQSDADLRAGEIIKYPAQVTDLNSASTFKPYNASVEIGSTTPALPYVTSPSSGCTGVGAVIVIAVAKIIEAICTAIGTIIGGWCYCPTLGAAIGAAVGDAIGQEWEKAWGVQEHYSLKESLEAGVTAGVQQYYSGADAASMSSSDGGEVPAGAAESATPSLASTAEQAVRESSTQYLANYATARVIGDDNVHFSWEGYISSVASSGLNAAAGTAESSWFGSDVNETFSWEKTVYEAMRGVQASAIQYGIQEAFSGDGHWNATDVFGNAIGNAVGAQIEDWGGQITKKEMAYNKLTPAQKQALDQISNTYGNKIDPQASTKLQQLIGKITGGNPDGTLTSDQVQKLLQAVGASSNSGALTPEQKAQAAQQTSDLVYAAAPNLNLAASAANDALKGLPGGVAGNLAQLIMASPDSPAMLMLALRIGLVNSDVYGSTGAPWLGALDIQRVSQSEIDQTLGNVPMDQQIKLSNANNGFSSGLYHDSDLGTNLFSNRGSVDMASGITNISHGASDPQTQYQNAADIAVPIYNYTGGNVIFTGHSLGGGLAALEALKVDNVLNSNDNITAYANTNVSAITYNAAGLTIGDMSSYGIKLSDAPEHVVNYRMPGELLTGLQENPVTAAVEPLLWPASLALNLYTAAEGENPSPFLGIPVPAQAVGTQVDLPYTLDAPALDLHRMSSPIGALLILAGQQANGSVQPANGGG